MKAKEIVRLGYDRVSYAYRSEPFADEHPAYGMLLSWLQPRLPPGSHVLDLGCGCGIPMVRVLSGEHHVTGVDISPVQIGRARRLVPAATFICADMTTLEFEPASFDAIVALYSIIHVPLEEQPPFLAALARWLRPQGLLLVMVGHTAWTGIETDWLGVAGATMYWSHGDAETYRRWLREAGLAIVQEAFVPESDGGHTALLCEKRGNASHCPGHTPEG
jgi:ubiquinone/menaquinone biosynthesis C-methylase UbiE